ncbi:MAG: arylesterase, partial [Bacteroidota bacterium]
MKKIIYFVLIISAFLSCSDTTEPPSTQSTAETPKTVQKAPEAATSRASKKTIVFFGNSLTAAYGLDPAQGFVGLIGEKIDSLGLNYRVVNAGWSGET